MPGMKPFISKGHVVVERVAPQIDCGRFRAKAVVDRPVPVGAHIFRDEPEREVLRAVLRYKGPNGRWGEAPMELGINDVWTGTFTPTSIGRWKYTVEAWTDHFATWRKDLVKRVEADQNVDLELQEGARLIEEALEHMPASRRKAAQHAVELISAEPGRAGHSQGVADERVKAVLDRRLMNAMVRYQPRHDLTRFEPVLELTVDRERALVGAWYEFFPRSTGTAIEHGTFETARKKLPAIADMGFDVVYLPPIHPIGSAFRKGKNNSLIAEPDDVGSPWAIGNVQGGHKAVHPDLGTIDDFDAFVKEAEGLGLDVAIDYAIQCSPDHPWVTEHPEWFHHRPDGSIKYAENPPKKYQDVYPVNFDTDNKEELWLELKDIFDFWIAHGVKIFRVDNPHTKPFPFWHWVIEEIQTEHPDVLFLAEAFTRPKVMQQLAKLGFSQSYTYFTWRNTKWELAEYLTELTQTEMAWYFRPNFFANTPDILHEFLQIGGPPAFRIRLVLAALLSPTYGIYSGYEFFERTPRERGSEEYLNSEKYELRPRDLSDQPNLVGYITRINEIRRRFPVLQQLTNVHFHLADKDRILVFSKTAPGEQPIVCIVNLNPFQWEESTVHLDMDVLGLDPFQSYEMQDLLTDETYVWTGPSNYVRLDPQVEPAHIFHLRR